MKSIKGFIFYPMSLIIGLVVITAGFIYGIFKCFYKKEVRSGVRSLNNKLYSLAIAKDMYGNMACHELLNAALLTKESSYQFGMGTDTISKVIAINYYAGTLTNFGHFVANLLITLKDSAF